MKSYRFTMNVLGFVLLFSSVALAQTATGSISGTVTDESGAVIPGVNVSVTNVDTGIGRSFVTDASGRYHVPTLISGHYEIQAQVTGFETGVRKGIQLTVGSELEINLQLRVGQVAEKTIVTAEAPLVETATSALVGLVDDKQIRDLPLNGRSFDQLIALESSAPVYRQQTGSKASLYSINGGRSQSNMYLMDGTEMLSGDQKQTNPGGALGINMGVDAIQEFSILASNYSPAYGKKGGGVINIATRSGTNSLHGSAFEFLRNSALDAKNFFDQGTKPPPLKRHNFGGSLGGPIRKDQSFFFGNYEGLRLYSSATNVKTVPDANAHLGLLPGPNGLMNVGVADSMKPYLAALYPLPNGRIFGDGTGEFISNTPNRNVQDFYLVRFDQRISDKDSFFARYNFTRAFPLTQDAFGHVLTGVTSHDQLLTLEEKRAYVKTVNVLRFGFTRGNNISAQQSTGVDPSLYFTPAAVGIGALSFSGTGASVGAISTVGTGIGNRNFVVNQFDVGDQVFHYVGAHSFQFGIQMQRIQHNDNNSSGSTNGQYTFTSLPNLLAARSSSFMGVAPGAADAHKSYRQIYFDGYINDDYKVSRNLTLNLGLRYELMTVPVEVSGNRISNYHYKFVNGLRTLDRLPTVGSPFWHGTHDTFAPRFGFAWDTFGDGKLAVRGGFGIFYDQNDSDWRFVTPANSPFTTVLTVANPSFPHALAGGGATPPVATPETVDTALPVPTRLQYSLGIQRQVTSGSVVNLSYVGSHSYHLGQEVDWNSAVPTFLSGGVVFYPAGQPHIQPALANSKTLASEVTALYNSLQMNFTQRATHGFRYKVSYTFSKNEDEADRFATVYATGEPAGIQNPFDLKAEFGLSALNVKHSLVMNFDYDVPWSHLSGFTGKLIGGWQVGGIATLQSGSPFTAVTGINSSRDSNRNGTDRPDVKPGASNNPILGGPDRYFDPTAFQLPTPGFYGNLGRNTLVGPGFATLDFTLAKMTSVNERMKVDFRAEFFNFLNHPNFALPASAGAIIFNTSGAIVGSAGRIQSTVATSRQIQFGLKLLF